ncbi:MAG: nicotinate-nucleotide pyrophosphorylase (carboxylating) [Parasphingorhabdus sp.]
MTNLITNEYIQSTVKRAISEDLGSGDLTANLLDAEKIVEATIISRKPTMVCGSSCCTEVFQQIDNQTQLSWLVEEGDLAAANTHWVKVAGTAKSILTAE